MFHLVVTRAFGQYRAGDQITDPAEIDAARRDYAGNVVQVIPTATAESSSNPPPSPMKARKSQ